jgi:hypothetical protein
MKSSAFGSVLWSPIDKGSTIAKRRLPLASTGRNPPLETRKRPRQTTKTKSGHTLLPLPLRPASPAEERGRTAAEFNVTRTSSYSTNRRGKGKERKGLGRQPTTRMYGLSCNLGPTTDLHADR